MRRAIPAPIAAIVLALSHAPPAQAQQIDLSSGGPVEVTASNGLEYDRNGNTVTARGDARAVRGDVTVTADELIAHLRHKAGAPPNPTATNTPPAMGGETGDNEIYRLEAIGHVHIATPTDQAEGANRAIYDIDQSVLVLTGPHLTLTTPQQVMTARDSMEYWSQAHRAVGRGDAVVTTRDGRQIAADTLVGYTTPDGKPPGGKSGAGQPPARNPASGGHAPNGAGKLQRVEAYGHVRVRTANEIVTGDRGVYVPDRGIARLLGNVHITRGLNQLSGAEAVVNMKTGISTLSQHPGGRVRGLVVPNQASPAPTPGRP